MRVMRMTNGNLWQLVMCGGDELQREWRMVMWEWQLVMWDVTCGGDELGMAMATCVAHGNEWQVMMAGLSRQRLVGIHRQH